MDNLPQKKSLLFLGLFYSFWKKKQLCRRNFFNSSPFSSRKFNLKTQFFYNNTTRSGWFAPNKPEKPLFLNFQIEFWIEKISSTKLFLFAIRIKWAQKNEAHFLMQVTHCYLDEFFEEFIYGRWYSYLEQTIYHLCRPISCWISSLAVEYHLLGTIISYVAKHSSPLHTIIN
jgi:hypothetical protein